MPETQPSRRDWRDILTFRFWLHRRVHLVVLIWAAIYLPRLGSLEIRGEEGRRILPAATMIETGNYLVPHVGSEPYFRKPPLINWIIAASFKITGIRSEWTARLPSALFILAAGLAFAKIGTNALGPTGSFIAALVWLVNAGNIEKGRLIEIEALYVSLTALAFIFWMSAYRAGKTELRLWFLPAIFLGLGLLAKGPLPHLLFFYGPVIAILATDRKLALLTTREHLVGLLIVFGIFSAWALPAFLLSDSADVARVWTRQFSGRVSGEGFQLSSWITNIPRSLVYFLPWLPLGFVESADRNLQRRSRTFLLGILVPLIVVELIPGALPRFIMPALGPAAWWSGESLSRSDLHWPSWLGAKPFPVQLRNRLLFGVTAAILTGMLAYAVFVVPKLQQREKVIVHARQINALVPPNVTLYAVDPEYQPYLFYVRAPVQYVSAISELPRDTKFFLVQPQDDEEAQTTGKWAPALPQLVLRIRDYRKREAILFAVASH